MLDEIPDLFQENGFELIFAFLFNPARCIAADEFALVMSRRRAQSRSMHFSRGAQIFEMLSEARYRVGSHKIIAATIIIVDEPLDEVFELMCFLFVCAVHGV